MIIDLNKKISELYQNDSDINLHIPKIVELAQEELA